MDLNKTAFFLYPGFNYLLQYEADVNEALNRAAAIDPYWNSEDARQDLRQQSEWNASYSEDTTLDCLRQLLGDIMEGIILEAQNKKAIKELDMAVLRWMNSIPIPKSLADWWVIE